MVKNLGLVKAIFVGTLAPTNTSVLWYDTLNNVVKYYHSTLLAWIPLGSILPSYIDDASADAAAGGTAPAGFVYYNTSANKMKVKEGVSWKTVTTS